MKNAKQIRGSCKFGRPELAMARCLSKDVLGTRHKFKRVETCVGAIPRTAVLAKDSFIGDLKKDSIPFKDMVSTEQQTNWWSPGAKDMEAPTADLQMKRDLASDFSQMRSSWLGGLFKMQHMFVFAKAGAATKYYLPGTQIADSSVLCLPLAKRSFPGSNAVWFQPMTAKQVCLVTVVDINDSSWVACRVSWRSWLWQ